MEARNESGQHEGGISSHEEKQADLRHVSNYSRKGMATAWRWTRKGISEVHASDANN